MVVFGLGGESCTVAQKAMLASWFKDSTDFPQLAFATGLTLTFGYLGVIINRWTVPTMAGHSVPAAYFLSVIVCTLSFLALGPPAYQPSSCSALSRPDRLYAVVLSSWRERDARAGRGGCQRSTRHERDGGVDESPGRTRSREYATASNSSALSRHHHV